MCRLRKCLRICSFGLVTLLIIYLLLEKTSILPQKLEFALDNVMKTKFATFSTAYLDKIFQLEFC